MTHNKIPRKRGRPRKIKHDDVFSSSNLNLSVSGTIRQRGLDSLSPFSSRDALSPSSSADVFLEVDNGLTLNTLEDTDAVSNDTREPLRVNSVVHGEASNRCVNEVDLKADSRSMTALQGTTPFDNHFDLSHDDHNTISCSELPRSPSRVTPPLTIKDTPPSLPALSVEDFRKRMENRLASKRPFVYLRSSFLGELGAVLGSDHRLKSLLADVSDYSNDYRSV